ncbi:chemotaxis protein CheW [Pseudomonas sp. B21-028]|uniref:chemotaxis protein CheW n=1 Tax=Pseudomonas TaxID=286 RepID=UPI00215F8E93|nr:MULTISPECIES: chemotaxis protein CheW [Pseudomonas]UVL86150.1 chemotaxis protein CheW [Pseudomonas sp. B21-028]UVM70422.1 chemotaxis protein CheW [Pseudomonas canavaninivorans]
MDQVIDIHGLGFWLFLMVPGTAMLVWLVVHLLRVDVKTGKPVDPSAEVYPVNLDPFALHTIGLLTDACAAYSPSREESVASSRLPVLKRSVTDHENFIELADKMYQLAELIALMDEKKQVLAGTAINPQLAADKPIPDSPNLSLMLGGERFAISALNIHTVVEARQLFTKLAMPSKLRSAIRVGNTLVPVIDLGIHLAGRPVRMSWSTCVVVLEVGFADRTHMIGVVVDAVGGILRVSPAQIEQTAIQNSKIRNDFILGMVLVDNYMFTLLGIERGLSANGFVLPRSLTQPMAEERTPT